jgi:hypothetical protein
MPDTADTVIGVPDDEWSYHSKYVEQFTNVNKLYIAASFWTIIDIYFTMHEPSKIKYCEIYFADCGIYSHKVIQTNIICGCG